MTKFKHIIKKFIGTWQIKAFVVLLISLTPNKFNLYYNTQLKYGRLISDPFDQITAGSEILNNLDQLNFKFKNSFRVFEIGTGHEPLMPLIWYFFGSGEIYTVDLHNRYSSEVFARSLNIIAENQNKLFSILGAFIDHNLMKNRFDTLFKLKNEPNVFLREANIHYLSPYDATNTNFSNDYFDLHFSNNVFEHINTKILNRIILEGRRILSPNGIAIHKIDESDHFAHTDNRISLINFLRFNEISWNFISGNQYSYCNRLRESDYIKLFQKNDFTVCKKISVIDEKSEIAKLNGFKVHKKFNGYDTLDLCTVSTTLFAVIK
jgi:SAM-dependent methyltransferase